MAKKKKKNTKNFCTQKVLWLCTAENELEQFCCRFFCEQDNQCRHYRAGGYCDNNQAHRTNHKAPTLEECAKYQQSEGLNVDPKRFYGYYSATNWIDANNNPVKNWKLKMQSWHNRNLDNGIVQKNCFGNGVLI